MANKITLVVANSTSNGNDVYYPFASGTANPVVTTQAQSQVRMNFAGSASNLTFKVISNAGGIQTLYIQKNGANAISIATTSGGTGVFKNTTDTLSWVAGDDLNFYVERTGTSQFGMISCDIETADDYNILSTWGSAIQSSTASSLLGNLGSIGASNAVQRITSLFEQTLEYLSVHVTANTRDSDTDFYPFIEGVQGNNIVTFPASTTGMIEDTSNTDVLDATDRTQTRRVTNTGTGSITTARTTFCLKPNVVDNVQYAAEQTISTFGTDNTVFSLIGSYQSFASSNISLLEWEVPANMTISNWNIALNTNGLSTDGVFTMYKNGSPTSLVITVTAGVAGYYENTVDSISCVAGDLLVGVFNRTAGSRTCAPRNMSFKTIYDSYIPIGVVL